LNSGDNRQTSESSPETIQTLWTGLAFLSALSLLALERWMALKHGPIALTSHNGLPIWIYGVAILIFVVIVRPAIRQIAAPLRTLHSADRPRGWAAFRRVLLAFSLVLLNGAPLLILMQLPYDRQTAFQVQVRAHSIDFISQGASARFWQLTTDSWRGHPFETFSSVSNHFATVTPGACVDIRLARDALGRLWLLTIDPVDAAESEDCAADSAIW
jgi:hypothetical protein